MKKILIICGILLLVTGCKSDNKIDLKDYKLELVKKETNCSNDSKETEYYNVNNQKVYLVCMEDINIVEKEKTVTLKEYLKNSNSIDDGISKFTANMELETALKDGGTKIYKKGDFRITTCQVMGEETNKDVYITVGESKAESRCK